MLEKIYKKFIPCGSSQAIRERRIIMGVFSTIGGLALNMTGSQSGTEAATKIIKGAFDIGVGVDNVVTNHKVIRPMAKKIDGIASDTEAIKRRVGCVMSDTDDIKKRQEAGINLLMNKENKSKDEKAKKEKAKAKAEKAKAKAEKAKAEAEAAAKKAVEAEAEAKKAADAKADAKTDTKKK
jgi:hypothetical protein